MGGWYIPDGVVCLSALILAMVLLPTHVRRLLGGSAAGYVAIMAGLALMAVTQALDLAVALRPQWSAHVPRFGVYLPIHAGGYVLLLSGFLVMFHDWVLAQAGARRSAEKERRRADDAQLQGVQLRRERDFVRGILETSELAIIGLDITDGRLTLFNRGAELVTGYARAEVLGREYTEALLAPEDRDPARRGLADGLAGNAPLVGQRQHTILTKDGERRLIAWTYSASLDDAGQPSHLVAFGRDVTAERRMQARLQQAKADLEKANVELARLAATDALTDLVNRRQADVLLEREAARARRLGSSTGIVMIDVDHFKNVNDSYGHKVGDAALVHLARRLRSRVRASDIVARYGGEELLLILPDTDIEGATGLAEMLRRSLEEALFQHGDANIRLTGSFGVAVMPPDRRMAIEQVVRMADKAMYAAKARGRNQVVTWTEIAPAMAADGARNN